MKEILFQKLHQYIRENNPDILLPLEEERKVTAYLQNKISTVEALLEELQGQPIYIIEERCMEALTEDLRPSKFNYIKKILEEEFDDSYKRFIESGTLMFEGVNLVTFCQPMFEAVDFTEDNEDNSDIKNIITGSIAEYLDK